MFRRIKLMAILEPRQVQLRVSMSAFCSLCSSVNDMLSCVPGACASHHVQVGLVTVAILVYLVWRRCSNRAPPKASVNAKGASRMHALKERLGCHCAGSRVAL